MPKISIIMPCYFSEENIAETTEILIGNEALFPDDVEFEYVFVDDDSRDNTFAEIMKFYDQYPHKTKVVKLAKNAGSYHALLAGMNYATGDCNIMLAPDLQDPPELIPKMYEHWRKGVKFVVANRVGREESFFQSFLSNIYHFLIRTLALKDVPEGGFDLILFDKQLREEIVKINEPNTNIIYLLAWLDFDYVAIPYIRRKREKGKSMWTFKKKFNLFINSLVSFTNIPLRISLFAGVAVLLFSFVYFIMLLSGVTLFSSLMPQFDWLALFFMFFAGIIMVFLGILGEYMWKAIEESRNRPTFIIDKVIQNKPESQSGINRAANY